jgi:hypothetical protein
MERIKSFAFLICITFFLSYSVHSQNVVPNSESLLAKLRLNESIGGIKNVTYDKIKGDPYIYKDFHEGELILKNGETFRLDLRYDIYGDQVHLKNNDNIYGIIHPEKISLIVIDTVRFLYCGYVNSPASESSRYDSYFILKTDGKCKLLIRKNVRIQDAEPPKPLQDAKPARFIHTNDSYYLKLENKNAVLMRNKKDIISVLTDQKEALNKFISSNKSRMNKIEDLIKIVDYYNNL